jgi:hypothetical protein
VRNETVRIEIVGRDEFWSNAVLVEWKHQHPERELITQADHSYLIDRDWLSDLNRIAADCNATIVVAPEDPSRRLWFRQFLPFADKRED